MLFRTFTLLLSFVILFQNKLLSQEQNLRQDKELVNTMLLCISHGGYPIEGIKMVSKKADTASIHKKLRVLGIRWEKHNYRRDSIQLSSTFRLPIEGTKQVLVLVYFKYRNIEWDEMLLLINKEDNLLMDIANNGDVFFFKKYYRFRYHNNKSSLYNYFYPNYSYGNEMQLAVKNWVRMALDDKKDSLQQLVYLSDTSYKADGKRLGVEWQAKTEKKNKEELVASFIKTIKSHVASFESLAPKGDFYSNKQRGTCYQTFRCTTKGKELEFNFQKQDGQYKLYQLRPVTNN